MHRTPHISRAAALAALGCLLLALSACAVHEPRQASGIMDTPRHHYDAGMRFLDRGELTAATLEFNRALELDGEYGPALAGKGLVRAEAGADQEAVQLLDQGRDKAKTEEEELLAVVAAIRAHTARAAHGQISAEDLVDATEDLYEAGQGLNPQDPALHFWQGEAYLRALDFDKAEGAYGRVVAMGGSWADRADGRWQLVQKVRRAAPSTRVGKKIALVDKLSRADMAGLLVEELGLDRFFERTTPMGPSSFKAPETPGKAQAAKAMPDVLDHPLRTDVEAVVGHGVRGLMPFPDGSFRPDEPLTRAEVAMILEDIVIRARGDASLASRYVGRSSPFSDVRPDHSFFNAVMLCTTRGFFTAEVRTGRFRPMDPVAGVDALLAVRKLKSELSLF